MPPLGEPAETARIRETSNLSPLLSSSPHHHSFASFRFLFPFEVAFLQKLDCGGRV